MNESNPSDRQDFLPGLLESEIDRALQILETTQPGLVPPANPSLSQHSLKSFADCGRPYLGRIQASIPYFGWYRVAIEGLGGVRACCRLSGDSSPSLFGSIDTVTLPPDCAVWVLLHPTSRYGFILGAAPSLVEDGNLVFSDWVSQGSNVGFREQYHSEYIVQTGDEGGVQDFSNQRPLDNLTTDWGRTTATGVGLHVDPFLAYLRCSEICGLFVFYPSETTRLAGRELQVISGAHAANWQNDEGECIYHYGETPYPWELLGAFAHDTAVHVEAGNVAVHTDRHLGKYEPKENDQQPFYRYEEYGGYLGQGRIRQMSIPGAQHPELQTYQGSEYAVGVFREFIGLDGAYFAQTAKSYTVARVCQIPVPKRKRTPGDYRSSSDAAANSNYKSAGVLGDGGAEHKLAELGFQDPETHLVSVLGHLDHCAYVGNWQSLLGFHYHEGDFWLPQADESELASGSQGLDFSQIKEGYGFEPPEPVELDIDPRYRAKFYQLMSLLHFTDDGGIILRGGRGEQITLADGQITLDAPANIHVRSGKSTVVLAGDDAIVRARNSVDITATEHDVRIKAEKNFQLLAANGGEGALLLESRSSGRLQQYPEAGGEAIAGSGIVLKSAHSPCAVLAGEIYLRTGKSEGGIDSGKIVLDAAQGSADIIQLALSHHRFIKSEVVDTFGFPRVTSVNRFSASSTLLGGTLALNSSLAVRGSVQALSGFSTAQGHFQSPSGGEVGKLADPGNLRNALEVIRTTENESKSTSDQTYNEAVDTQYYQSGQLGHGPSQKKISFSLRTEKEYNTSQFRMLQAHWQLLAENSGDVLAWQEKEVRYQGETPQMPWPGKAKWSEEETFLALPVAQHTLYDIAADAAKDRPGPYRNPQYGTLDRSKPSERYKVIDC